MRHIWSVLCSSSSIDVRTNIISIFNVLERLEFQGQLKNEEILKTNREIRIPISFEFVTFWSRSNLEIPETALVRLMLLPPNGKERLLGEYEIDVSVHSRTRQISQIQNFPYSGNGTYEFVLQLQSPDAWETVVMIPFEVIRIEVPSEKP
jgi:hypothetical protein